MSTPSDSFRKQHFPASSRRDWGDWQWQLRNRYRNLDQLEAVFELSEDERRAIRQRNGSLPLAITPYYASLLAISDPHEPLRRTMIPSMREYSRATGEHDDPLGEEAHSPVHGIVHTYPAKALFLVSDHCATYCRYCTRSRVVGSGEIPAAIPQWETALDYIRSHPEIEDVLISGGDPLTLTDDKLEWLLAQLHAIEHVRLIRIGTKTPAVLPQRFTPGLARMLKRYHPLWISVHFTHPRELTPEVTRAVNRLTNAGIPLANQTVLLAGINDDPATMRALMDGLVRLRIRPYYLHQCDAVTGSSHFRTPVERGLEIIRSLHGFTTGYAVPTYMIDAPGGGGKVPIMPDYVAGRENGNLLLRNFRGEIYRYPDH